MDVEVYFTLRSQNSNSSTVIRGDWKIFLLHETMANPDWLTAEFFQSCLQAQEEQPITVTGHTVRGADVPDGSNYGSQLFRAKVDFSKGSSKSSISLIVKAPLTHIEETFSNIYEKEPKFYNEYITATYKYSKHDIVPKHYFSPNPSCVVLEDLSTSGYVMVDRHSFLDLDHCELYIKSSAKLHALSMAVYRENPDIIESLANSSQAFINDFNRMTKAMMDGGLRSMAAYLEEKSDCKYYLEVIEEASKNDNLWKLFKEMDNSNSKKAFKALIQLDPWCTNMMFKYNSVGKVESIKILDFQSLSYTTPLKELVTFISVSPNMEVRETKLNYLYHLYCDTLNDNLASLGCPERLTFEDMTAEILAMSPLVMFLACSSVPTTLAEGSLDVQEIISGNMLNVPIRESSFYKLYQSEIFNHYYPQILNLIAKEGVFDFLKGKLKQMASA